MATTMLSNVDRLLGERGVTNLVVGVQVSLKADPGQLLQRRVKAQYSLGLAPTSVNHHQLLLVSGTAGSQLKER